MTAANYKASLDKVLVHEGGFSNHPKDPGGATMKGVTQAVYDTYRVKSGLAKQTVAKISDAELQAIYRNNYWNAVRGDDLPAGVDYVVFDGAVNSGPSRSIKWLQQALGITADGVIGPQTLKMLDACVPNVLIDSICDRRLVFLKSLDTWPTFGKGWASRVAEVRADGKMMAAKVQTLLVDAPVMTGTLSVSPTPSVPTPLPAAPLDHVPVEPAPSGFVAAFFNVLNLIASSFKRK